MRATIRFAPAWAMALAAAVLPVAPAAAQQDEIEEIPIDIGTFDLETLASIFPQFVFRPIDDLTPRVGARAAGMSGAYLAEATGAEALGWNPAGLAFLRGSSAVSDVLARRSSGKAAGYPVTFEFPDAPPLFLTGYEENLKSRIRFGFLGAAGPLFQLGSRPVVGGIAYRRRTDVAYPEEVLGEFRFQEGAGLPVVVAVDVNEKGTIESATLGMGYELLPSVGVGASLNLMTGRLRADMSVLRNIQGLPLEPGTGNFNLDYKGISGEAGVRAAVGRWLAVAGWVGFPYTLEVSGGSFRLKSLGIPGEPVPVIFGRLGGYDLDVPLFYSIGASLRPLSRWLVVADFNVRPWGQATVNYHSREVREIPTASDVFPAHDVESFHVGLEYLLLRKPGFTVPVRAGFASLPLSMASVDRTDRQYVEDVEVAGFTVPGDGDPLFFGDQVDAIAWSFGGSVEFEDVSFHVSVENRRYEFHRFFFESTGPYQRDELVNPNLVTPTIDRLENLFRVTAEYRF